MHELIEDHYFEHKFHYENVVHSIDFLMDTFESMHF